MKMRVLRVQAKKRKSKNVANTSHHHLSSSVAEAEKKEKINGKIESLNVIDFLSFNSFLSESKKSVSLH